jgi:hypothetical protein
LGGFPFTSRGGAWWFSLKGAAGQKAEDAVCIAAPAAGCGGIYSSDDTGATQRWLDAGMSATRVTIVAGVPSHVPPTQTPFNETHMVLAEIEVNPTYVL